MRIVHTVACLVMILFIGVQYNDPDYYFWMPVYAVPALWAGLAAWSPHRLRAPLARVAVVLCTVLALLGTAVLWPTEPGFWRQDVWWESETAREGMGMMVVAVSLLLVTASAFLARGRASR